MDIDGPSSSPPLRHTSLPPSSAPQGSSNGHSTPRRPRQVADALAFERGLDRMSKSAERPGNVHHRKGEACPVCGDTIRAVEYSAYEVNYCPTCQTGGKVLADNTTSKFLK